MGKFSKYRRASMIVSAARRLNSGRNKNNSVVASRAVLSATFPFLWARSFKTTQE